METTAPLMVVLFGQILLWKYDPVVISAPVYRPKTGFQLWLEENRKSITADQPDLEETGVIKEAMGRFRMLSAEERLVPHRFQIRFIIYFVIVLTVFGLNDVKVHIKRSSPHGSMWHVVCGWMSELHVLPQKLQSCFPFSLTNPSIRV